MFFINAPASRDGSPDHCFEVTVPTYSAFEGRIGDQVASIHHGDAAITLWTVKGIKVSDTPSDDPDDLRGPDSDGEYVYADGLLGDRVIVSNPHHGTVDILPHMLMSVEDLSDW